MSKLVEDGFIRNRLFLTEKTGLTIQEIIKLRPHVIKLHAVEGTFILKGYPFKKQLIAQIQLTHSLRKNGFKQSCSFQIMKNGEMFFWADGKYWALMPFIKPIRNFLFSKEADRQTGARLLHQFHSASVAIPEGDKQLFHPYVLFEKWQQRYTMFYHFSHYYAQFIGAQAVNTFIKHGYWTLGQLRESNLSELEQQASREGSLIHGDCAEHNFIRGIKHIYLIDYDLVTIAPSHYDFLQYANRILPHLNWSLEKMKQIFPFDDLMTEEWFLIALTFPADIFREWNRFARKKTVSQQDMRYLQRWTLKEIKQREKFVEKIQAMVR